MRRRAGRCPRSRPERWRNERTWKYPLARQCAFWDARPIPKVANGHFLSARHARTQSPGRADGRRVDAAQPGGAGRRDLAAGAAAVRALSAARGRAHRRHWLRQRRDHFAAGRRFTRTPSSSAWTSWKARSRMRAGVMQHSRRACGSSRATPSSWRSRLRQFDLVVCRHMTQSVPEPQKILAELWRICRPGGWVHVLSEDYGMIHSAAGQVDPDRLWHEGVIPFTHAHRHRRARRTPHLGADERARLRGSARRLHRRRYDPRAARDVRRDHRGVARRLYGCVGKTHRSSASTKYARCSITVVDAIARSAAVRGVAHPDRERKETPVGRALARQNREDRAEARPENEQILFRIASTVRE